MSVFANKFPVYQMRCFEYFVYEGDLVLLQTYFDRYILDDKSLPGDFFERRFYISMHPEKYEYKLYNLKVRCNNISQILHLLKKGKHFIGSDGKPFKYKPHKTFYISTYPVVNIVELGYKKYLSTVKVDTFTHLHFVVDRASDYLQLVKLSDKSYILYNTCSTYVKDFRRKL